MNSNHLLYIGLNGFAGSGKDTVAKMLKVILNNLDKDNKEDLYAYWKEYNKKHKYATSEDNLFGNVYTVAFADQLKKIASDIFGIDIRRFYDNKTNGWININGTFEYSERKPLDSEIITAEDYASSIEYYQHCSNKYWMSIRECLVYIGTYILQRNINRDVFVNIIKNKVNKESKTNELKYVICTDVRFMHEVDFIRDKKGIFINIIRDDIQQLSNIAEHDLDNENEYDFTIYNDGTYEDLWNSVWEIAHNNDIFKNEIIQLESHDESDNYLRLVKDNGKEKIYRLCPEYCTVRASHNEDGSLGMIDPSGGPYLTIGSQISYKFPEYKIKSIFTKTEPFGFYLKVTSE